MRSSLFLLSAFLLFSPLVGCESAPPSIPTERIIDKVSAELAEQFTQTLEAVEKYSHANPKVLETAGIFLAELSTSYSRGEGMIDLDIERILAAVRFAAEKHQFQTRKDSEQTPYIIHPIGVAEHLFRVGRVRDPDIVIAALLHDTVEDTETTFEEIQAHFGERVEKFVREVTDDKSLSKEDRKWRQVLHAPHKSAGAAEIKLCDKWYNLSDLFNNPPPDWNQERITEYFNWAEEVTNALPWVNAPLKNAVDQMISAFREKTEG